MRFLKTFMMVSWQAKSEIGDTVTPWNSAKMKYSLELIS